MAKGARLAGVLAALALAWAGACAAAPAPAADGPFADWAAVVVAGDYHAHNGGDSEAFDNARRDVSRELHRLGFKSENLRQFSVRPQRYRDTQPLKTDPRGIYEALKDISSRTGGGCLVYFTSHGAPNGVLVDEVILTPRILGQMLDASCGAKPTVVVLSACFSGVFVKPLAEPNRMILTAARPDRTSFGCGEDDKYPYFDDCLLQSTPKASDFAALGKAVQACVAAREIQEGMKPPSEPQLWVGPQLRPMLPLLPFANGPPGDD